MAKKTREEKRAEREAARKAIEPGNVPTGTDVLSRDLTSLATVSDDREPTKVEKKIEDVREKVSSEDAKEARQSTLTAALVNTSKQTKIVHVIATRLGYYKEQMVRVGKKFDYEWKAGTALPLWVKIIKKKPAEDEETEEEQTGLRSNERRPVATPL